jgi:formate-dependent nitrite reductase cytochrome c552 subunit
MGPRFLLFLLALCLASVPLRASGTEFIGPESCKVCHPAAYDAWRDSQHSHAAAALSPKQQKDGRCLSCHSPEQARNIADVGCETCHGGGQYYAPRFVMRDPELARAVGLVDPGEKMCLKCHDANAPSLQPFKLVEKLKLIDHWTADRAAKKERREARSEKSARDDKPEKADKAERADKPEKADKTEKSAKGKPSR